MLQKSPAKTLQMLTEAYRNETMKMLEVYKWQVFLWKLHKHRRKFSLDKSKGKWCWRHFLIAKVSFTTNSCRGLDCEWNTLCRNSLPPTRHYQKEKTPKMGREQLGLAVLQCFSTAHWSFLVQNYLAKNITALQNLPCLPNIVAADFYLFMYLKIKLKRCFVNSEVII